MIKPIRSLVDERSLFEMACNWIRVLGLLAIFSFCHGADLPDVKRFVDAPEFQEAVAHMFPDQNNTRTGRITNGSPATSGQLPYQVYMYLYVQSGGAYLCGGSVSDSRFTKEFFLNRICQIFRLFTKDGF